MSVMRHDVGGELFRRLYTSISAPVELRLSKVFRVLLRANLETYPTDELGRLRKMKRTKVGCFGALRELQDDGALIHIGGLKDVAASLAKSCEPLDRFDLERWVLGRLHHGAQC
jgi:hypothetical protein